jgi:hypothetical protein
MLDVFSAAAYPRQVQVDVHALSLLSGVVVPLLVGFLTKARAHSAVKAISLAVLSTLAGLMSLWLKADGSIDLWTSIDAIAAAFVAATASYYGFWRPTGIAPAISDATADIGIGTNLPQSHSTVGDFASGVTGTSNSVFDQEKNVEPDTGNA